MKKELEEAIEILSDEECKWHYSEFEILNANKTVLDALKNSTPNDVLYDLAREMRRNGSMYYASRIEEIMGKHDKLKKYLKEQFQGIQAFNTRNIMGDVMETVYKDETIIVDYCYEWNYIEIFGLTDEKFEDLLDDNGHISIK